MKTVLMWLAVVFIISVSPERRLIPLIYGADKVFHFLLYGITCALFYVEFRKPFKVSLPVLLVICVVLASAYGLLMEIAQGFTKTRHFSLYDALANMLGAVVAAVAIAAIRRKK